MSLGEIANHLRTAHEETEATLNQVKGAIDNHLQRAHVAVGAASAAGLDMSELNQIAGQLSNADRKGTELVELLAAAMSNITDKIG